MGRGSAYEAQWICEHGHEWPAVVYQRTYSTTECPECQRLAAPDKGRAAAARQRFEAGLRTEKQLASLPAPPIEHEPPAA